MAQTRFREREAIPTIVGRSRARPVMLGTLAVRVDPEAERVAIEAALEAGAKLLIANLRPLQPMPLTAQLARDQLSLPHEEDLEQLRATAERAATAGIRTELLRVSSVRPIASLLELAAEREVGLLVFGPDRGRLSSRRFRAAVKAIRRDANCLVWIAADA